MTNTTATLFDEESCEETHSAGGKKLLKLPAGVIGAAVFGGGRQEYRYRLERRWDKDRRTVMFVMMNPSTANPSFDDPTVAKCRSYARCWGFTRLLVGNTFAYRATDQKLLLSVPDPIGPQNDGHLLDMAQEAQMVVFAYGLPHKSLRSRGMQVAALIQREFPRKLHVLKLCADGTPSHPLYLRGDLKPIPWRQR